MCWYHEGNEGVVIFTLTIPVMLVAIQKLFMSTNGGEPAANVTSIQRILVTSTVDSGHALDREHGWRGSMAAALQTSRHVHNERARRPIQRALATAMVVSSSHSF
jgi:hypothetical protein